MKYLFDKKVALVIIAVCLVFLFNSRLSIQSDLSESGTAFSETSVEPADSVDSLDSAGPRLHERIIYMCRLGDEEIPAVQISETSAEGGQVMNTVARAAFGPDVEIKTPGAPAEWDYKSVSARSGENIIEVAFEPGSDREGYDWVLTLANENTYLKKRVKDCMEVSDE